VAKRRIDSLLVERGLVESRAKAQALIMAGEVRVEGKAAIKPGMQVAEEAVITLLQPPPFVSRGGIKLDHALEQFRLDVSSKVAADIGASTGGFTDCLLQRGASRVYAVDVGYGQLDYRLRQDERVVVMERVNARYPITLAEKVDLATLDLSFISVEKVIPSVARLLKENGCLVVLLKPQFEAKRSEVGKGGVVRQPIVHARVLGRFIAWALGHGFRLEGLVASPILGVSGNMEFFVLLRLR
jgi:23S rRNA (cytidine1920-2'-O)/16S rRNA (cytidine1409-2'-O)-methyltransferase